MLACGFKMRWVSLQMISLGYLLLFSDQTLFLSAAPTSDSRCISKEQLKTKSDRFMKKHWKPQIFDRLKTSPPRTCAQATQEMRGVLANRSLTPWKYSIHEEVDRIPSKISFAECLCQGCIINQQENLSYNSVPVFTRMKVMKKTKCDNDPQQYVLIEKPLPVPVACTCAVPK